VEKWGDDKLITGKIANHIKAMPILFQMNDVKTIGDSAEAQVNQIKYRADSMEALIKEGESSNIKPVPKAWVEKLRSNKFKMNIDLAIANNVFGVMKSYQ